MTPGLNSPHVEPKHVFNLFLLETTFDKEMSRHFLWHPFRRKDLFGLQRKLSIKLVNRSTRDPALDAALTCPQSKKLTSTCFNLSSSKHWTKGERIFNRIRLGSWWRKKNKHGWISSSKAWLLFWVSAKDSDSNTYPLPCIKLVTPRWSIQM